MYDALKRVYKLIILALERETPEDFEAVEKSLALRGARVGH